jgi:hypothetical protein
MKEVVRSGQAWTAGAKVDKKVDATALNEAKKITEFTQKLAKIVPEQEALSELTVSNSWGAWIDWFSIAD